MEEKWIVFTTKNGPMMVREGNIFCVDFGIKTIYLGENNIGLDFRKIFSGGKSYCDAFRLVSTLLDDVEFSND